MWALFRVSVSVGKIKSFKNSFQSATIFITIMFCHQLIGSAKLFEFYGEMKPTVNFIDSNRIRK